MSRFSYPKVPGDSLWSVADVTGPNPYSPIVVGTPPSGGQVLNASDFGLQSIDWVQSMASNNGHYGIVCVPGAFSPGNPMASVRLMWVVAATGAEVGAINLSAFTVRLMAIGR
jgi:hypothetical protein